MTNQVSLLRTQPAHGRGNRLYPPKTSRVYWHLTRLRQEMERTASRIEQEFPNARLVDYGCGNMPYRPILEQRVAEYIGCDLHGNELADELFDEDGVLPFDDGSVDVVLSSQVLEHVERPGDYLCEAHRVLKENGLLILSTHGMWRYHPDPCDFWRWTCDGLKTLVTQNGFRVDGFTGIMGLEATALQLWQDAVLPRVPGRLVNSFIRYTQWRMQKADARCSQSEIDSDACVFFVAGRKTSSSA